MAEQEKEILEEEMVEEAAEEVKALVKTLTDKHPLYAG